VLQVAKFLQFSSLDAKRVSFCEKHVTTLHLSPDVQRPLHLCMLCFPRPHFAMCALRRLNVMCALS
jgi:hypothetical protein